MGLFKDCGCGCNGKKQEQKLLISIMSALVFFVIANPETFRVMRRVFGSWVSSPTGCPSTGGLALHTIVFMLVTWGMMNIKREEYAHSIPKKKSKKLSVPHQDPHRDHQHHQEWSICHHLYQVCTKISFKWSIPVWNTVPWMS